MFNASGDYLTNEHKIYKVGIYARLSREDETKGPGAQSDSIEGQLAYLNAYAFNQGWNVVGEYYDDGYSGGNFDRPGFSRLINDIEARRVNLVITKDLSRLGREMSETTHYAEKYFAEHNIRYIALNDDVDTFAESAGNDMIGMRTAFNDMYLRDASKKIKSALNVKKEQGLYTGPYAPYGYAKDKDNKHKLIIDDAAAETVRRIYDMYTGGVPMLRIAATLNKEDVPPPSEYKRQTVKDYNIKGWTLLWEQHAIRDILSSSMYIGCMTQGKFGRVSYKSKKLKRKPKDRWIIVEGTHEPIIDREIFETAQYLLSKNQASDISNDGKEHLLNGLIYCGECGEKIYLTYARKHYWHTICSKYRRFGKDHCRTHRIPEETLNKYVLSELSSISKKLIDSKEIASKIKVGQSDREYKKFEKDLIRIDKRIEEMKKQLVSAYQDKLRGILTEDEFLLIKDTISSQRDELVSQREELAVKLEVKKDSLRNYERVIQQLLTFDIPNRSIILQLVERITIYHRENGDKEIKVQYTFPNPFED